MIRPALATDAEAIVRIYNHYVLNTVVTFEEQPVIAADMVQRMKTVEDASFPWLVAEREDRVVGYAYASRWHARSAYRHSTECTVYLDPSVTGQGLGSALYRALFPILRDKNVHTVIGGIALPNEASVALHEKFGFVKVSHFKEIGFKFDRWVDVGHWQGSPASREP